MWTNISSQTNPVLNVFDGSQDIPQIRHNFADNTSMFVGGQSNSGWSGTTTEGRFKYVANGTDKHVIDADGMSINSTSNPTYGLNVNTTDAIKIPVGTTAQRPTGTRGMLRYNTTTSKFEGHTGSSWADLESSDSVLTIGSTLTALNSLTASNNKMAVWTGSNTAKFIDILDEDNLASNSANAVGTQQSFKAYVDNKAITNIANNAVGSNQIANNAVTASEIAGNAVGSSEIANGAVGSTELSDGAVITAKIQGNAVTAAKIANDAVTGLKIADDAVAAAQIADNAVGAAALNVSGSGASGQSLLSDGAGGFAWGSAAAYTQINHTFNSNKYVNTSLPAGIVRIEVEIDNCRVSGSDEAFVAIYIGTSSGYTSITRNGDRHIGNSFEGIHFAGDSNEQSAPIIEWGIHGSTQRACGFFTGEITKSHMVYVQAGHWRKRTDSTSIYFTSPTIDDRYAEFSNNITRLKIVGSRYDSTKNTTEYNITSGTAVIRY